MKKQLDLAGLNELTEVQLQSVSGGIGPIKIETPMAEDLYGNKMSHEEWMDYMAHHIHQHGDATSTDPTDKWVHDFTN